MNEVKDKKVRSVGVDIGSRTVKLVIVEDGNVVHEQVQKNQFDHQAQVEALLEGFEYDILTATGYGRHNFEATDETHIITEIKAFALGCNNLISDCRTILDIGGQDTKAISLDNRGRVKKFIMNDRCAAGTGRFLEIMANALNFSLAEFGEAAATAELSEKINNMCTVFAESEVISTLTRGAKRESVALGIHESIVDRSVALLDRVGVNGKVVFVGGVAYNPALRKLLKERMNLEIETPESPQTVGALGCAIHGHNILKERL